MRTRRDTNDKETGDTVVNRYIQELIRIVKKSYIFYQW